MVYAVTADQRASRSHADLVPSALDEVSRIAGDHLLLAPDRTAGDEIQALTSDPSAALQVALHLTRTGHWSIGIGVGDIETPLPPETRAARGAALVHARTAVERAKSTPTRVAVAGDSEIDARDAEAFLRLLVDLRDRRTEQGWEVIDLLATGITQREAADALGISPPAVSMRVRSGGLRLEEDAIPGVVRALARIDGVGAA